MAAFLWGFMLAVTSVIFSVAYYGNSTRAALKTSSESGMQPLRKFTFFWICLAGGIPCLAAFWATFSPVWWDPHALWSLHMRDMDDILIILVYGKAIRFCNIHTRLNSKLFRIVVWVEYACAVFLVLWSSTPALPSRHLPTKRLLSPIRVTIALKSVRLAPSLASLLISIVAWRQSKAEKGEIASTVYSMVWGAAAWSLRIASEIIVASILDAHNYSPEGYLIGGMVTLHLCLAVYVLSTAAIVFTFLRLATALTGSTVSMAVDRYGRGDVGESDRDFGQIRLPDYPTE